MQRDLHSNILDKPALAPQAVTGTVTGPWLDTAQAGGFEGATAIINYGAVTTLDATHTLTPKLQEANDPVAQADAADVAAADYLNAVAPPAVVNSDVHGTTQRIGYRGYKRFVRLVLTAAGGPSVLVSAVWVLSHPKFAPTPGA